MGTSSISILNSQNGNRSTLKTRQITDVNTDHKNCNMSFTSVHPHLELLSNISQQNSCQSLLITPEAAKQLTPE